jgi:hypothetical protein
MDVFVRWLARPVSVSLHLSTWLVRFSREVSSSLMTDLIDLSF